MNRLKELRVEAGIGREKLAAKAGLSSRTIAYIEEEGRGTRLSTARDLAKALSLELQREVSVEELFPEDSEVPA